MSKKFKIAQAASFKQTVKIPRVGGESIDVEFEYVYLTRPQLTKLNDKWHKAQLELLEGWEKAREEGTLEAEKMNEDETEHNVNQIKDIVISWGFEDKFTDENIRALVETSLGATDAVIGAYNEAYQKAKLGN